MLQSYKDEFVVEIQFSWFRRLLAGVKSKVKRGLWF